jgi:hypothetical protein
MSQQSNSGEVVIFSAVKVSFDYSMKISGAPDFKGSGSVIVKGINPSLDTIKQAVEAYVTEKAVLQLGQSKELSLDADIKITDSSKINTRVNITPR